MKPDPEVVSALVNAFALIVPEVILLVTACVLFLGSTFRADRYLWGTAALVGLGAAGLALWLNALQVPTLEARQSEIAGLHKEIAKLQEDIAKLPERSPERRAEQEKLKEKVLELRDHDSKVRAAIFSSPLLSTRLALFIKAVGLIAGVVFVLLGWNEVSDRLAGEYHACLLLIVAGLCLTGSANELITLFLSLELISIPTYVLLYLSRFDKASQEAAMKYFLLSVFSSALLLFGFSYLYGLTGTTNIPAVLDALTNAPQDEVNKVKVTLLPGVTQIALVMILAGLGFKITAVPFHFYAPDVYQGAPTAGAALLAFVPKTAGFVALMRVLGFVPADLDLSALRVAPGLALGSQEVAVLLWILAAVTMTIGNVLALQQDNLKRLLAYSSVAHAGYMLIGLAVAPYLPPYFPTWGDVKIVPGGVEAVLFYLVAYGGMTVGAFAVVSHLSTPRRPVETVDDLAGLSRSHPGVALLMAVFLFSLIGMPLTAGFWGKLLLFLGPMAVSVDPASSSKETLFRILAVIGALNAAIGAWYYLRIIALMYLRNALKPLEKVRAWPGLAAISICAAVTLIVGVYPPPLWQKTHEAVPRLTVEPDDGRADTSTVIPSATESP